MPRYAIPDPEDRRRTLYVHRDPSPPPARPVAELRAELARLEGEAAPLRARLERVEAELPAVTARRREAKAAYWAANAALGTAEEAAQRAEYDAQGERGGTGALVAAQNRVTALRGVYDAADAEARSATLAFLRLVREQDDLRWMLAQVEAHRRLPARELARRGVTGAA